MTIETKFNELQEVWFMDNNVVRSMQVWNITIEVGGKCRNYEWDSPFIFYNFQNNMIRNENQIFATKEELLKSL